MRYASVCSGIEAPSVAWEPLGWEPVWFSEIEPFPCEVLKHHYPDVPNHGDMTKIDTARVESGIDVLIGGTPCQSFSVAGLRGGLDDDRGNLALVYMQLVDKLRPRWVVWENVPGVLSSNGGRDFGAILGALSELGYGWAYRILDAQWFGVPQRRRRVFLVGHSSGLWQRAAAVLFDSESLSGNPPPRREKGEGAAGRAASCAYNCRANQLDEEVSGTLQAKKTGGWSLNYQPVAVQPVANALQTTCHDYSRADGFTMVVNARQDPIHGEVAIGLDEEQNASVETMGCLKARERGGGFEGAVAIGLDSQLNAHHETAGPVIRCGEGGQRDAVRAAANQHAVVCADNGGTHCADAKKANTIEILRTLREAVGEEAFQVWGLGILASLWPSEVLRQALHDRGIRYATFSKSWLVHCSLSRTKEGAEWLLQSLRETECKGCPPQGWQPNKQFAHELGAYLSELSQPGPQVQRYMFDLWQAAEGIGVLRETLSAIQEVRRPVADKSQPAHSSYAARRLTAEECEFLQGFPRNYTRIPWRNKPAEDCPDTPRYKALGNSMAVPVIRWIGERIEQVEKL